MVMKLHLHYTIFTAKVNLVPWDAQFHEILVLSLKGCIIKFVIATIFSSFVYQATANNYVHVMIISSVKNGATLLVVVVTNLQHNPLLVILLILPLSMQLVKIGTNYPAVVVSPCSSSRLHIQVNAYIYNQTTTGNFSSKMW